ncbi:MAG TPA: hemolysin family protein [Candidatus Anammoximicrobium sp.]|nr:hemolysin family protein [Candidatus Anammoximicrobium sp.]
MEVWAWLGLLTIPLFVAINGFFVAAEFALVAVRKTRVEEMVHHGQAGAKAVEIGVDNLDRTIAATQLGITLASIALGWIGEPAVAKLLEPVFAVIPHTWRGVTSHSVAFGLGFLLITFLHVVFGELIPKTVALQIPDRAALWVATPLVMFARAARPLIFLMNGTGNAILRWIGFEPASGREMLHSVEELALLIEDTEEAGILSETQAEVVQKVFRLSTKRVRDCMVPRDKMASLELSTPPEKVLEATRAGAHTRMPIYEKDGDNIVGIVNTKDLFYLFSLRGIVVLEDAMYPALFLNADDEVAEGLKCFRSNHRHMAVVRDAEGHVLGLITLEDIIEEIVGEIEDEHDWQTPEARLRGRHVEKLAKPAAKPAGQP